MADYLGTVREQVRKWDAERPRSLQRELGWSDMASCRAYMGFEVAGEWASDDDENWRAIAGTAMHAWLTDVRRAECAEDGVTARFGLEVTYRGIPGHLDECLYDGLILEVTDYKFPSLSSSKVWDDPKVRAEKFVQVHGYAAGALDSFEPAVRHRPRKVIVRMLVCPVDGTFDDWRVYEEDFDRGIADLAADRYEYVKAAVGAGEPLPKDKPEFWCEKFCEFYRLCRGDEVRVSDVLPLIEDEETATALERYGEAKEQAAAADAVKKAMHPLLHGARGRARGWQVTMSKRGQGGYVTDMEQVEADYQADGAEVPKRWQEGQEPRLLVVREKG